MRLVVGLGNPGRRYSNTRHNIGFFVLRELAQRHGGSAPKNRFDAEIAEAQIGAERMLLLAPQTYMNASGRSIRACVDYFGVELHELIVVCDDMNLPLGQIRFRPAGSSGGQKGLQSVIDQLGTEAFPRGRVGIGRPPDQREPTDYVLSRFQRDEEEVVGEAVRRVADGIELWIAEGIDAAMNRYNGPQPS